MATHAHAANHSPGSSGDKKARSDGNGPWSDGSMANIGSPFTPMVETAGVTRMAVTPSTIVQCPCGSWVHYDGIAESFTAQCCGEVLTRDSVADPVPCSCHA